MSQLEFVRKRWVKTGRYRVRKGWLDKLVMQDEYREESCIFGYPRRTETGELEIDWRSTGKIKFEDVSAKQWMEERLLDKMLTPAEVLIPETHA